jgi:hypothetical protein
MRRDLDYFYSGAPILGKTNLRLVAPADNGKVLLKKKFSQRPVNYPRGAWKTWFSDTFACRHAKIETEALRGRLQALACGK